MIYNYFLEELVIDKQIKIIMNKLLAENKNL